MIYAEFQAELRKAGLSIGAFADLVGMKRNSVSNYAGATNVPHHCCRALKIDQKNEVLRAEN